MNIWWGFFSWDQISDVIQSEPQLQRVNILLVTIGKSALDEDVR